MKHQRVTYEQRERPHHWKLDGKTPVPMADDDVLAWAQWFHDADRIVKQEHVGRFFVSTVFLGLDHNFGFDGPPILFETMIFGDAKGGELDGYCERCATWDEALVMHERAVALAREKVG